MGIKIASLYAEIGADSIQLQNGLKDADKGLANTKSGIKSVDDVLAKLIVTEKNMAASKEAKDHFDKMTQAEKDAYLQTQSLTTAQSKLSVETENVTESTDGLNNQMDSLGEGAQGAVEKLTGLSLSALTAGGAIVALADGLKKSVEEFISTTDEMRNLSNLTGNTVEEVSRLGDIAEKTGVDMSALTMALQAADRKGISPNIQGLMQLSDQYVALAPGVERAHFLMDNFGRGGADLANIMELGSAGIKKMAAETGNLEITTAAMVEEDKKWKAATSELTDQVKGPMMQMGFSLVSLMNSILKVTQDSRLEFKPWAAAVDLATQRISEQRSAERDLESQRLEGMGAMYAEMDAAAKSGPIWQGNSYQMEMAAMSTQHVTENLGTLQKTTDPVSLAVEDMNSRVGAGTATWDSLAGSVNSAYQAMLNIIKTSPQVLALIKDYGAASGQHDTHAENVNSIAGAGSDVNNGYTPPPKKTGSKTNATGGAWEIPAQYGYEGYQFPDGNTASGGEVVTVAPKGKSTAGAVINQYFYGLAVPVSPTQEIAAIKAMLATGV